MKVLLEEKTSEIVEKKSRFIANVFYVETVEEAEKKLEEIRKTYYDAKHNCYAYILGVDGSIVKSSDDGEPSGTAGHPMLQILKGLDITNCIAIVTRYFGGILLGTGGLVRCYSDSLKNALKDANVSGIGYGYEVEISVNYDDYGKIERYVSDRNYKIENEVDRIICLYKDFNEIVKIKYLIPKNLSVVIKEDFIDISKGKIVMTYNEVKNYYIKKSLPIIIK